MVKVELVLVADKHVVRALVLAVLANVEAEDLFDNKRCIQRCQVLWDLIHLMIVEVPKSHLVFISSDQFVVLVVDNQGFRAWGLELEEELFGDQVVLVD